MFGFRYPAVIILAFVTAGTLLGYKIGPGESLIFALLLVSAVFLLFTFLMLSDKFFIYALGGFILMASFFGAARKYQYHPPDDISSQVDSDRLLRFFGEVDQWPVVKRHNTLVTCSVDSILVGDTIKSTSGLVLLNILLPTTHFTYGDQISFSGRLLRPSDRGYPGGFDYQRFLFSKGIRGVIYIGSPLQILVHKRQYNILGRSVHSLRLWIQETFRNNLTGIPAALASGFLIGETRDIPQDIYDAFRRTGTLHLLAVSGSNVAIVILIAVLALRFIPMQRYIRLGVLLALIIIFCNLSYNQPSVIRASVMASLVLIAAATYRRLDLNNIIAAAAAILIIFDPGHLFDIGFQLSFAVAWALILFLPQINRLLPDIRISSPLRYFILIVSSSFIASLVASPITAYYFGQTSLITIFSNLIIVPLVSIAVAAIIILLAVNLIFPALTILPGAILDQVLMLIYNLVAKFGSWKMAAIDVGPISAFSVYTVLVGITLGFFALTHMKVRRLLVFYFLSWLAVVMIRGVVSDSKPYNMEVFNRGNSQAIIIHNPPGIVIYHQNQDSRSNHFSEDLLRYLIHRGFPDQSYFIFMAPAYRARQNIDRALADYPDLNFYPLRTVGYEGGPLVYSTADFGDLNGKFDNNRILIKKDCLEIIFDNGQTIIIADKINSLNEYLGYDSTGNKIYLCLSTTLTELRSLCQGNIYHNFYLLPEIPLNRRNKLNDKELKELYRYCRPNLIEIGDNLFLYFN